MTVYCLDTNVISAVIAADALVTRRWIQAKPDGHGLALSAMTYYEVKRGLDLPRYARKYSAFLSIVDQTQVLMPTLATYDVAAQIYQTLKVQGNLIEDADIIIAATALSYGSVLVTRNLSHMNRVVGLQTQSWHAEQEDQ